MSTNIFEHIVKYASHNYYEKYAFQSEEYSDARDEILALQRQYADMPLSEDQKQVIDRLLKVHSELCDECMEKVYEQGLRDCAVILKALKII